MSPSTPRMPARLVSAVVAVVAAVVAIGCWWAAQDLQVVPSPERNGAQIQDRVWDTRWLAAAVLAFDVALVAAVYALVPRLRARHRDAGGAD